MEEKNEKYDLISYSLFGKSSEIYQIAVPYIVISNNIAYPNFKQRFHVADELQGTACYKFLERLSSENDLIQLKTLSSNYKGIKPMLWRVMPWWDKNVKYLFCRDIDSSVTKKEIQAVRFFLSTKLKIHTIRSHKYHTTPLMGGLCAFDCVWLRTQSWFPDNFKSFIKSSMNMLKEYKPWVIGSDQEALKRFIYNDNPKRKNNMRNTLDTFVQGAPSKLAGHNPKIYSLQRYKKIDISDLDKYNDLFKLSDKIHSFIASPFKKIKISHLQQLLSSSIDTPMSDQVKSILSEPNIKEFYKV